MKKSGVADIWSRMISPSEKSNNNKKTLPSNTEMLSYVNIKFEMYTKTTANVRKRLTQQLRVSSTDMIGNTKRKTKKKSANKKK